VRDLSFAFRDYNACDSINGDDDAADNESLEHRKSKKHNFSIVFEHAPVRVRAEVVEALRECGPLSARELAQQLPSNAADASTTTTKRRARRGAGEGVNAARLAHLLDALVAAGRLRTLAPRLVPPSTTSTTTTVEPSFELHYAVANEPILAHFETGSNCTAYLPFVRARLTPIACVWRRSDDASDASRDASCRRRDVSAQGSTLLANERSCCCLLIMCRLCDWVRFRRKKRRKPKWLLAYDNIVFCCVFLSIKSRTVFLLCCVGRSRYVLYFSRVNFDCFFFFFFFFLYDSKCGRIGDEFCCIDEALATSNQHSHCYYFLLLFPTRPFFFFFCAMDSFRAHQRPPWLEPYEFRDRRNRTMRISICFDVVWRRTAVSIAARAQQHEHRRQHAALEYGIAGFYIF
jgi:hypothetical protein